MDDTVSYIIRSGPAEEESGTPLSSPMCEAGIQAPASTHTAFQDVLSGSWVGRRAARTPMTPDTGGHCQREQLIQYQPLRYFHVEVGISNHVLTLPEEVVPTSPSYQIFH